MIEHTIQCKMVCNLVFRFYSPMFNFFVLMMFETKSNGGCNAVMELVDLLLTRGQVPDATMQQIEDLDKNEKF